MMAPVGNYINAIGLGVFGLVYDGPNERGWINYLYVARLWFAIATLFAIVLFTITFKRSFNDHHSDARNRPTLYIWLATASVAGPAYLAVAGDSFAGTSLLFQSLWYIALFLFTIFGVGWLYNFFQYEKGKLSLLLLFFLDDCSSSLSCLSVSRRVYFIPFL
jgi:tellurite resistance protein TehA-like permease